MEWTSTAIQIWFFPRDRIPASINEASNDVGPDPSTFGLPIANFQGSCNIDAHFFDHSLVFDTTFCGSYAGNLWAGAGCPLLDPTNVSVLPNAQADHGSNTTVGLAVVQRLRCSQSSSVH